MTSLGELTLYLKGNPDHLKSALMEAERTAKDSAQSMQNAFVSSFAGLAQAIRKSVSNKPITLWARISTDASKYGFGAAYQAAAKFAKQGASGTGGHKIVLYTQLSENVADLNWSTVINKANQVASTKRKVELPTTLQLSTTAAAEIKAQLGTIRVPVEVEVQSFRQQQQQRQGYGIQSIYAGPAPQASASRQESVNVQEFRQKSAKLSAEELRAFYGQGQVKALVQQVNQALGTNISTQIGGQTKRTLIDILSELKQAVEANPVQLQVDTSPVTQQLQQVVQEVEKTNAEISIQLDLQSFKAQLNQVEQGVTNLVEFAHQHPLQVELNTQAFNQQVQSIRDILTGLTDKQLGVVLSQGTTPEDLSQIQTRLERIETLGKNLNLNLNLNGGDLLQQDDIKGIQSLLGSLRDQSIIPLKLDTQGAQTKITNFLKKIDEVKRTATAVLLDLPSAELRLNLDVTNGKTVQQQLDRIDQLVKSLQTQVSSAIQVAITFEQGSHVSELLSQINRSLTQLQKTAQTDIKPKVNLAQLESLKSTLAALPESTQVGTDLNTEEARRRITYLLKRLHAVAQKAAGIQVRLETPKDIATLQIPAQVTLVQSVEDLIARIQQRFEALKINVPIRLEDNLTNQLTTLQRQTTGLPPIQIGVELQGWETQLTQLKQRLQQEQAALQSALTTTLGSEPMRVDLEIAPAQAKLVALVDQIQSLAVKLSNLSVSWQQPAAQIPSTPQIDTFLQKSQQYSPEKLSNQHYTKAELNTLIDQVNTSRGSQIPQDAKRKVDSVNALQDALRQPLTVKTPITELENLTLALRQLQGQANVGVKLVVAFPLQPAITLTQELMEALKQLQTIAKTAIQPKTATDSLVQLSTVLGQTEAAVQRLIHLSQTVINFQIQAPTTGLISELKSISTHLSDLPPTRTINLDLSTETARTQLSQWQQQLQALTQQVQTIPLTIATDMSPDALQIKPQVINYEAVQQQMTALTQAIRELRGNVSDAITIPISASQGSGVIKQISILTTKLNALRKAATQEIKPTLNLDQATGIITTLEKIIPLIQAIRAEMSAGLPIPIPDLERLQALETTIQRQRIYWQETLAYFEANPLDVKTEPAVRSLQGLVQELVQLDTALTTTLNQLQTKLNAISGKTPKVGISFKVDPYTEALTGAIQQMQQGVENQFLSIPLLVQGTQSQVKEVLASLSAYAEKHKITQTIQVAGDESAVSALNRVTKTLETLQTQASQVIRPTIDLSDITGLQNKLKLSIKVDNGPETQSLLQALIQQLDTVRAKINDPLRPQVDLSELAGLNAELDLKQSHLLETQKFFNTHPITADTQKAVSQLRELLQVLLALDTSLERVAGQTGVVSTLLQTSVPATRQPAASSTNKSAAKGPLDEINKDVKRQLDGIEQELYQALESISTSGGAQADKDQQMLEAKIKRNEQLIAVLKQQRSQIQNLVDQGQLAPAEAPVQSVASSSKMATAQNQIATYNRQLGEIGSVAQQSRGGIMGMSAALADMNQNINIGFTAADLLFFALLQLGTVTMMMEPFRRAAAAAADFSRQLGNIATNLPAGTPLLRSYANDLMEMEGSLSSLVETTYETISALGAQSSTMRTVELSHKQALAGIGTETDAMYLLTAVTKAYGDTSFQAQQRVADITQLAVVLGQTTLPEITRGWQNTSAAAATAGIKIEEVSAVFAALSRVTGTSSEVGTQLQSFILALESPSKDLLNIFSEVEAKTGKTIRTAKDFIDASGGLAPAVLTVRQTAAEKGIPLQDVVGREEAVKLVNALPTQMDRYSETLQGAANATGLVDEASEKAKVGVAAFGFEFERMGQSLERVSVGVGAAFGPTLTPFFKAFNDSVQESVQTVNALPGPVQGLLAVLTSAGAGTALVTAGVIGLTAAMTTLGSFLSGPVKMALTMIGGRAFIVSAAISALASVMQGLGGGEAAGFLSFLAKGAMLFGLWKIASNAMGVSLTKFNSRLVLSTSLTNAQLASIQKMPVALQTMNMMMMRSGGAIGVMRTAMVGLISTMKSFLPILLAIAAVDVGMKLTSDAGSDLRDAADEFEKQRQQKEGGPIKRDLALTKRYKEEQAAMTVPLSGNLFEFAGNAFKGLAANWNNIFTSKEIADKTDAYMEGTNQQVTDATNDFNKLLDAGDPEKLKSQVDHLTELREHLANLDTGGDNNLAALNQQNINLIDAQIAKYQQLQRTTDKVSTASQTFANALSDLNAKLAANVRQAQLNHNQNLRNISSQVTAGSLLPGQAGRMRANANQDFLQEQISTQSADLKERKALLATAPALQSPDLADLKTDMTAATAQKIVDRTELMGKDLSDDQKRLLDAVKEVDAQEVDISNKGVEVADAAAQMRQETDAFTLQITDFFRQVERSVQDMQLELQTSLSQMQQEIASILQEISNLKLETVVTQQKTRMRQAFTKITQKFFGFSSELADSFDQVSGQFLEGLFNQKRARNDLNSQLLSVEQRKEAAQQNLTQALIQLTRSVEDLNRQLIDIERSAPTSDGILPTSEGGVNSGNKYTVYSTGKGSTEQITSFGQSKEHHRGNSNQPGGYDVRDYTLNQGGKTRGVGVATGFGGVVEAAGGGKHNVVRIRASNGKMVEYLHMDSVSVTKGSRVTAGQVIGTQGDRGAPGAIHVHLQGDKTLISKTVTSWLSGQYSGGGGRSVAATGSGSNGNVYQYLARIAHGESNNGRNIGRRGKGPYGEYQFMPGTRQTVLDSTGYDAYSTNKGERDKAAISLIQRYGKEKGVDIMAAISKGDFSTADKILGRKQFTSLPGGAEASPKWRSKATLKKYGPMGSGGNATSGTGASSAADEPLDLSGDPSIQAFEAQAAYNAQQIQQQGQKLLETFDQLSPALKNKGKADIQNIIANTKNDHLKAFSGFWERAKDHNEEISDTFNELRDLQLQGFDELPSIAADIANRGTRRQAINKFRQLEKDAKNWEMFEASLLVARAEYTNLLKKATDPAEVQQLKQAIDEISKLLPTVKNQKNLSLDMMKKLKPAYEKVTSLDKFTAQQKHIDFVRASLEATKTRFSAQAELAGTQIQTNEVYGGTRTAEQEQQRLESENMTSYYEGLDRKHEIQKELDRLRFMLPLASKEEKVLLEGRIRDQETLMGLVDKQVQTQAKLNKLQAESAAIERQNERELVPLRGQGDVLKLQQEVLDARSQAMPLIGDNDTQLEELRTRLQLQTLLNQRLQEETALRHERDKLLQLRQTSTNPMDHADVDSQLTVLDQQLELIGEKYDALGQNAEAAGLGFLIFGERVGSLQEILQQSKSMWVEFATAVFTGTETIGEAIRNMVLKVIDSLMQMMLNKAFQMLLGMMVKPKSGSGSGLLSLFDTGTGGGNSTGDLVVGAVSQLFKPAASTGNDTASLALGAVSQLFGSGFKFMAEGGVVTRPTAAVIGEGRYNEAVIPMPNGRAVPVEMRGGKNQNVMADVDVVVNNEGQTTAISSEQGTQLGGALRRAVVDELMRQKRPGGLLYA